MRSAEPPEQTDPANGRSPPIVTDHQRIPLPEHDAGGVMLCRPRWTMLYHPWWTMSSQAGWMCRRRQLVANAAPPIGTAPRMHETSWEAFNACDCGRMAARRSDFSSVCNQVSLARTKPKQVARRRCGFVGLSSYLLQTPHGVKRSLETDIEIKRGSNHRLSPRFDGSTHLPNFLNPAMW